MCLQFVLVVPQSDGVVTAVGLGRTGFIIDPRVLAKRYLKSWFLIDLLSVLVSAIDVVTISSQGQGDNNFGKLRALRVLRALRLIKLFRLARTSRIFKRWETYFSIDYAAMSLMSAGTSICFFAHLMACIWALQAKLVEDPLNTWLSEYCVRDPSAVNATTLTEELAVDCVGNEVIYTAALYWALMAIVDSAEVNSQGNVSLAATWQCFCLSPAHPLVCSLH